MGVHVLLAAAMIVMVVPADRMIVSAGWGAVVFGVAATTSATTVPGLSVALAAAVVLQAGAWGEGAACAPTSRRAASAPRRMVRRRVTVVGC